MEAIRPASPDYAVVELINDDDSHNRAQIMRQICRDNITVLFQQKVSCCVELVIESAKFVQESDPAAFVTFDLDKLNEFLYGLFDDAEDLFIERSSSDNIPDWIRNGELPAGMQEQNFGRWIDCFANKHLSGGGSTSNPEFDIRPKKILRVARQLLGFGQIKAYQKMQ